MSFIDLMASDVWSSADIDNKVQALIRSRYSAQDELKASRLARTTNPSDSEAAFVVSVDSWIAECVAEGRSARADMKLLTQVLEMEVVKRRLDMPQIEAVLDEEGVISNQADIDADEAERAVAQLALANADPSAQALFDLRNPQPPVEEPLVEEPVVEQSETIV